MITNKNPIFVGTSGNQDFGSRSHQLLPPKNVPNRLKLNVKEARPKSCRSEKNQKN